MTPPVPPAVSALLKASARYRELAAESLSAEAGTAADQPGRAPGAPPTTMDAGR